MVYVPSLSNGHALDDLGDIVENPAVHGIGNAPAILTSPYRGRVPPGRSPFRPLTSLSYALSWSMGDGAPGPFHSFNVGLHAANTALVTGLLTTLGTTPVLALVGGAIFAVHPVHSEAVANGVGRADALMTLFVLLGILAFLRIGRFRWLRVGLVGLAYALALGAKENGVVLPALLVAVTLLAPTAATDKQDDPSSDSRSSGSADADSLPDGPSKRRMWSEWPVLVCLGVVLVGYLSLRYHALGTLFHRDAAPYIIALPASVRMATAVANITELTRLLLFPADLAADYGPDVIVPATMASLRFWGGLAVAVSLIALGVLGYRRSRWISLGVLWTILALAVVGNLVFPVGVWIAERTLYLPSVGVSLLVIGVWHRLGVGAPRGVRSGLVGASLVLILLGGARTWTRNAAWADTGAVLLTLAEEHPESYRAQWWMGQTLIENQQFDRGLEWLRQAGEINPNELRVQLDYVRGLLLAGHSQEAFAVVVTLPALDPSRDVYLTQSHIQMDQLDEARAAVRDGLERFPNDSRLHGQARDLGVTPFGLP